MSANLKSKSTGMIINIPAIQAWWDATLIKIFRQIPYPADIRLRSEEGVLISEPETDHSNGTGGLRQSTTDRIENAEDDDNERIGGARRRRRSPGWRIWEWLW